MWKSFAAMTCLLGVAENAMAQKFSNIYSSTGWDFAISISATTDGGSVELGVSGLGPTAGTIVTRLSPTGAVLWAASYGDALWHVVRQTSDGDFVLFGEGTLSTNPNRIVPKILKIDGRGRFKWGREFLPTNDNGTPGNYARGMALVIEPKTGDLLVGGSFYPNLLLVAHEPWLAKLNANGNKVWLVAYANLNPNANSGISAVVSPVGGGLIGVGGYSAANLLQPFVAQVSPIGTPGGYFSYKIAGQTGWTDIADVISMGNKHSRIAGTMHDLKFCSAAGVCLNPLNTVAFTADLDETVLSLKGGQALWDSTAQFTYANSVEVDSEHQAFFIGGQATGSNQLGVSFREALFIESGQAGFFGQRYREGGSKVQTELKDLDRVAAKPGFVSAVAMYESGKKFSANQVLRTDMHGDSGAQSCQSPTPIFTTPLEIVPVPQPYRPRTWDLQHFTVKVRRHKMGTIPCGSFEAALTSDGGVRTGISTPSVAPDVGPSGGRPKCLHDFCVSGFALASECSPDVAGVCKADPYCCGVGWDDVCVMEISTARGKPPLCKEPPQAVPTPAVPVWIPCGNGFCPSVSSRGGN
jgi:hypothetical protein